MLSSPTPPRPRCLLLSTTCDTHHGPKVATLASMEQQLRAGVVPTLPHSREARSALALSLPPLAPVFSRASRAVTKVVDMGPVEPVRRKRKYTKQNKKAGEWVLVTTWQFSEKAFRGLSFAKELWMMMTSFGEAAQAGGGRQEGEIENI